MNISSLTSYEYVNLVGHYNKLTTKKRVDPRLLARGYSEEALKMLQEKMGSSNHEFISLDLHFKGDLDNWEYPHFNYVITLFDAYDRHGTLPYHGPQADQPAKIIEIFQVLDQLKTEQRQKMQEDHNREMEKQQRKKRR
jgi:hypothetical protein